jgi:uncharacterized protein (TIGR02453 family)
MGQGFEGWPEEAQRFFIGLGLDNSRAYFEANRNVYMTHVRAPMEALLAELEEEFGPGKVFRINRDIRFSADKSPYKTNIAATAGREGKGGYLSLSAKGLFVATGYYQMEREQLDRFREAVAADRAGPALVSIVGKLEEAGYDVGGEELKLVPRGYPRDHPRQRFLRHKGITMSRDYGLQPWLGTPAARDRVAEVWRDAEPLLGWLGSHVRTDGNRS